MHRRSSCRTVFLVILAILLILMGLPFLLPVNTGTADPVALADGQGEFVTVNGLRTHVVTAGPQNPDAIPVILIHGLYGSTFVWRNNLNALGAAGFRAIAFDRPGTGLADKPESANYSHAANADYIAALMDTLKIGKAVIVGHSAGGNVLAHFALRHPDRVAGLVVVGGAIVGAGGPPSFIAGLISFPPIVRWAQVLLPSVITRERLEASVASFHANPSFLKPEDYAGYWRAFQTPGWEIGLIKLVSDSGQNKLDEARIRQIGELNVPKVLIWGEADTWVPIAQGEKLAELWGGAKLIRYPGIGHQPMEEHADAFNKDLIAFLNTIGK